MFLHYVLGGTHIHYVMQTVIVFELLFYIYVSIGANQKEAMENCIKVNTIQMLNFH